MFGASYVEQGGGLPLVLGGLEFEQLDNNGYDSEDEAIGLAEGGHHFKLKYLAEGAESLYVKLGHVGPNEKDLCDFQADQSYGSHLVHFFGHQCNFSDINRSPLSTMTQI